MLCSTVMFYFFYEDIKPQAKYSSWNSKNIKTRLANIPFRCPPNAPLESWTTSSDKLIWQFIIRDFFYWTWNKPMLLADLDLGLSKICKKSLNISGLENFSNFLYFFKLHDTLSFLFCEILNVLLTIALKLSIFVCLLLSNGNRCLQIRALFTVQTL